MRVVVDELKHSAEKEHYTVSARIYIGDHLHKLYYKVPQGPVTAGADPFLTATLIPAMKAGGPLQIKGPVSQRLMNTIPKIQEIFHAWYPEFQKIQVEAEDKTFPESSLKRGVGSFFSAGIDSFYTLLKHRDEITHLIFVHGFDVELDHASLRARASKELRQIATDMGKSLIEVETNAREFGDQYVNYGKHYHGATLASVALLLTPQLSKVYIPSTYPYAFLTAWGSHPMLDPLWSTEDIELIHDGCEANRLQKTACIASCDMAMRSLRVCWEAPLDEEGHAYNCGRDARNACAP